MRAADTTPIFSSRWCRRGLSAALLGGALAAGAAETPQLAFPVACAPDRDCWIQNYVDVEPGAGVRDYACGAMTYDGHKGVDIRVADRSRLASGVEARAAAPGKVIGARDGMPDHGAGRAGAQPGRECGNGVRLEHGEGWTTQYCHLKRGSVRVRRGESVQAGAPLGAIGLSGLTEFPHLHFQLEKDGRAVDPFRGACGAGGEPLWRADVLAALPYMALRFFNSGFASGRPEHRRVSAGEYSASAPDRGAPVLTFWFELAGVAPGDRVRYSLRGPDGALLAEREETIAQPQAAAFRYLGRRRPGEAWPPGTYVGEASAERAGEQMIRQSVKREVLMR